MYVVAICRLASSLEDAAAQLARETRVAIYDARLKLSQPTPIIALRTESREEAIALLASLRSRGHEVVACDEETVAEPSPVRAFRFGSSGFERETDVLPYDDIVALVRASCVSHTETTAKVTERKLRPAAAIITGGLILSKKVTREEKRVAHHREDLLYVFGRGMAPGWVVSERGTVYASLDKVAPIQRENFMRVVQELRTRAPRAVFDERLLAHRSLENRDIDLRAHILAIAAARVSDR